MTVKRIVANVGAADLNAAQDFYNGVLGLDLVMDHGWIVTYAGSGSSRAQLSIATQGGSDTAVPDLSIEVDNLDHVLDRLAERGIAPEYGPVDEPWGVRRFYVRDPYGKLLNILSHTDRG